MADFPSVRTFHRSIRHWIPLDSEVENLGLSRFLTYIQFPETLTPPWLKDSPFSACTSSVPLHQSSDGYQGWLLFLLMSSIIQWLCFKRQDDLMMFYPFLGILLFVNGASIVLILPCLNLHRTFEMFTGIRVEEEFRKGAALWLLLQPRVDIVAPSLWCSLFVRGLG